MATTTRIEGISKDLQLLIDSELSPQARSKVFAEFARVEIDKAKDINRRAFGRAPPVKVWVDGKEGAALESVRPDGGTIAAEFQLLEDVIEWIDALLILNSPRKSGRYQQSHVWYADLDVFDPAHGVPAAGSYTVLNVQPYARKIERGHSRQAPNGVYEVVAALASRRFSNMASIYFTYDVPHTASFGGLSGRALRKAKTEARQPAIRIGLR